MLQPATAVGTFTANQAGMRISGSINRMCSGQSVGAWDTSDGTITLTRLTQTRVAGTFDFPVLKQLVPVGHSIRHQWVVRYSDRGQETVLNEIESSAAQQFISDYAQGAL